jgi:hypothetical protein
LISAVSFIPVFTSSHHYAPSKADREAFLWLKNNTENDSVVLALPEEGAALSYLSSRKNVMDDDYLMIRNIDTRYRDVNGLYKDLFLTTALERLNYYSVDYVFLSEYNQRKNNISSLSVQDDSCLKLVYPAVSEEEEFELIMKEYEDSLINDTAGNETGSAISDKKEEITPKIYAVRCTLLSRN